MIFLNFLLLIIFANNLNFSPKQHLKSLEFIFIKHCTQKNKSSNVARCVNDPLNNLFKHIDEGLYLTINSLNKISGNFLECKLFIDAILWMENENYDNEVFIQHINNASRFCENVEKSLKNENDTVRASMSTMQKLFNIMKADERITSDPILIKKEFLDLALSIIQSLTRIK